MLTQLQSDSAVEFCAVAATEEWEICAAVQMREAGRRFR